MRSGKDIASNRQQCSIVVVGPSASRNSLVVWVASQSSETVSVTDVVVVAGIVDQSPPSHRQPAAASFQRSRRPVSAED